MTEPQTEYAKVVWRPDDIIDVILQTEEGIVTVERAEEWLANHAKTIQEAMVHRGFDAIYDLLRWEPLVPTKETE